MILIILKYFYYIKNINSKNINSKNINSKNINSKNININIIDFLEYS